MRTHAAQDSGEQDSYSQERDRSKKGRRVTDGDPPVKTSLVLAVLLAICGWLCAWSWSTNTAETHSIRLDMDKVLQNQARDDEWHKDTTEHLERVDKHLDRVDDILDHAPNRNR